eukprot:3140995-Pleurochrysis_carterae.AAC.15
MKTEECGSSSLAASYWMPPRFALGSALSACRHPPRPSSQVRCGAVSGAAVLPARARSMQAK